MKGEIISRIKLDIAIMIIFALISASANQNENSTDHRTDFTDDRKIVGNNDEKKINIMDLRMMFSDSADLTNYLAESNIFKLDAKTIKDYLEMVNNDIGNFNEEMKDVEKEITKSTEFKFFQRICKNATSLFFDDQKRHLNSFEQIENVLSFIDNMSNKFWEEERSEDEIADFESFTADTNKTIAEYKKNLRKQVDIYNFCKRVINYKMTEQEILNCYLICYYSKIAFSYGFCGMNNLNGLGSYSYAAKELLNALLKDEELSEIHDIKNEIIPRLQTEDPNKNTAMVKKVDNLLKGKYESGVVSDEATEFEGKNLQELRDIKKELESMLMACEDDFGKIEQEKNEDFVEFNDYEKENIENFNNLVLEFYKPRQNLFPFFMCPKQSEDLEKNLLKDIRKITNDLLDFYFLLEGDYRSYYKKLSTFAKKSNSLKNKIQIIQNIININQNADTI